MPVEENTPYLFDLDNEPTGPCFEEELEPDTEECDFDVAPSPVQKVDPEDRTSYLQLALVGGVGPRTMANLIDHFGSPSEAAQATLEQLGKVVGIGPKTACLIRDGMKSDLLEKVREHCDSHRVRMLIPGDDSFPRLLLELEDPPLLLFVRGEFQKSDSLAIGMVGTRHCTSYGSTMASRLAKGLARSGLTIVSGLARGIDAICHRGAIEAGGRTIAVLGSSVTEIYPPEHEELSEQILDCGLLISETHPFSKPKAGVFPQRNRIISGLSLGVVVVEAAERSGSLITARHAGEQGRDVFAIPGAVTSRMSRGCNRLIRDGAILVQDAQCVLEHLGPLVEQIELDGGDKVSHPAELQLNEIENAILQCIDTVATDIDSVVVKSGLPVSRVLSTLSVLQMKGLIKRPSGRTVSR